MIHNCVRTAAAYFPSLFHFPPSQLTRNEQRPVKQNGGKRMREIELGANWAVVVASRQAGSQAPPLIMSVSVSVSVPRQAGRLCLPLVNLITGRHQHQHQQQLLSTPNTSIDGGFVMLVLLEQTCLAIVVAMCAI